MASVSFQPAAPQGAGDPSAQAQLGALLTSHRAELRIFLERWSLQQDSIIRSALPPLLQTPPEAESSPLKLTSFTQDDECADPLEPLSMPSKTLSFAQDVAGEDERSLPESPGAQPWAEQKVSVEENQHLSSVEAKDDETSPQMDKRTTGDGQPITMRSRLTRGARDSVESEAFGRSPTASMPQSIASSWLESMNDQDSPFFHYTHSVYSRVLKIKGELEEDWQWRKKGCMPRLVHSTAFEATSTGVIVANAAVMAYSVDYAMKHLDDPRNATVEKLELVMTIYYLIELICRMTAERLYFFFCDYYKWNLFDLLLVCLSLYEVIGDLLSPQATGGNIGFVRIVRIAKMLKMLRVVRILRSFRELRLIMSSMLGSMKTMLWSLLLIAVISFVVALAFMQNIASYATENRNSMPKDMSESIEQYWSSMTTAMASLYMSSTGGDSWSYVAEPLKTVGQPLYVAFMIYIAFFLFVIVNTLTSIFIEATIDNADQDQKQMIREEMKKKNEYVNLIKKLFNTIDTTGSGRISRDDFMSHLQNNQMLAFLSRIGIDAIDAAHFFDILADEKNSTVDVETFVLGCMKLRGSARSMDLLGLIHTHEMRSARLKSSISQCQSTLSKMQKQLTLVLANARISTEGEQPLGTAAERGLLTVPTSVPTNGTNTTSTI